MPAPDSSDDKTVAHTTSPPCTNTTGWPQSPMPWRIVAYAVPGTITHASMTIAMAPATTTPAASSTPLDTGACCTSAPLQRRRAMPRADATAGTSQNANGATPKMKER